MKGYVFFLLFISSCNLFSLPTNATVVSGTLQSIKETAQKMNYTVSDRAIVNWKSFSIAANESLQFSQPSEQSIILNRVTGNETSEILGKLQANGHVFLINPQGVIIGKDAVINAGSFLISTLDIADNDFLQQHYKFSKASEGVIINYGTIKTTIGDITLLGRKIENYGRLQSNKGCNIALAEEVLLTNEDEKIIIRAKLMEEKEGGFTNLGEIQTLMAEIKASGNSYSYAINLGGKLAKPSVISEKGKFYIVADAGKVDVTGDVRNNSVFIEGKDVTVQKEAQIEAIDAGGICITATDKLNIDGKCFAKEGNVTIQKPLLFWLNGQIDVSANEAGSINIQAYNFYNTGVLRADSNVKPGGNINIKAEEIIETQSAKLSTCSTLSVGGVIDVQADDRLYTSGSYIAKGLQKGGTIKIKGKDLLFVASKCNVLGNKKGKIILKHDEVGIYYTNSHTKFLGKPLSSTFVNKKSLTKEASLLGAVEFDEYDLVDPLLVYGGSGFGNTILPLSTDNIVVTKLNANIATATAVGAVYVYNGATRALVSMLTGSHDNDRVGLYVKELSNGNFLTYTAYWNNGIIIQDGAVTWLNGVTGLNGTVSASNSLVGIVNLSGSWMINIVSLSNGHYVVRNPYWNNEAATQAGAVTWCNGNGGTVGAVSASNSLVGTTTNDRVGWQVIALTNGHYVVESHHWNNGAATQAGAVTWCNGNGGTVGAVSASNSLVGTTTNDYVGYNVTSLSNGHYVVQSPYWDNGATTDVGAVTWCNGNGGTVGAVSASNSLVSTTTNDRVGIGFTSLSNGHYVVQSPYWDNGATTDVGAVTWCNGNGETVGAVSASNSLVGTTTNSRVGYNVTSLSNGHYVVQSPYWDNGATTDVGAVTWCDGNGGTVGAVSASNSLVGTTTNDQVGIDVISLSNGYYVVRSPYWNNGAATRAGAVTWCDGNGGTVGAVSASNSLVGTTTNDQVGWQVIALTNGHYVVGSHHWNNGVVSDAGAITWCNGNGGTVGAVSPSNSLVGTTSTDEVGRLVIALMNGHYVVQSLYWNNGAATRAGAVTWCNGNGGTVGAVSASNSLIGTTTNDYVGYNVTSLSNGHYVMRSPDWNNGAATQAGAVTWCNGNGGTVGAVSASNSLIGTTTNDQVGSNVTSLSNGHYVMRSPYWDNGATTDVGAVTWCDGNGGTVGAVSASNSLVGTTTNDQVGSSVTSLSNGNYVVPSPYWDNGSIVNLGACSICNGVNGTVGTITTLNSILGRDANSGLSSTVKEDIIHNSIYVVFANENGGSGRITVAYMNQIPPPSPSVLSTDQLIIKINNATLPARSEFFEYMHSFHEYIDDYLSFPFVLQKDYLFSFVKDQNRYKLKSRLKENQNLQEYFIRQKSNGRESWQAVKTL